MNLIQCLKRRSFWIVGLNTLFIQHGLVQAKYTQVQVVIGVAGILPYQIYLNEDSIAI